MIIEARYDLLQLFAPKIFRKSTKPKRAAWIIAMDRNLRQLSMKKVQGAVASTEDHVASIARALSDDGLNRVAYYALARLDTDLPKDFTETFEQQDEALRLAPELIDYELISTYLSNGKEVYGSGPRYSFRDYIGMEHLPRVAILPGPHGYPCDCLACTQHDELLRSNWERHHRSETESEDS